MADPFQSFLDQYKENCNTYVRRAPVRLLGLLIAFPVALGLAAVGAFVSKITGEPLAAGVVIFVGAIAYLVAWIAVARMLDRPAASPTYPPQAYPPPPGPSPYPPTANDGLPPGYLDPNFAGAYVQGPVEQAPWQQPAPARSSSGGCLLAALGMLAFLMLSCCGGGIFLSRFATIHAGPANPPFQAGAPFPGDPFADMHQQQRQLDEMLERQREQWREIERDRQRIGQGPGW